MANKKKEYYNPGPLTEGKGRLSRDCCRSTTSKQQQVFRKHWTICWGAPSKKWWKARWKIILGIKSRHTPTTKTAETDIRARFHFFRSEKHHQKAMDELWVASDYTKTYLGEWHTHDEDVPSPSTTDIKEWKRISKGQHNSSVLFFIIIGRRKIGIWTINHGNVTAVSGGKW